MFAFSYRQTAVGMLIGYPLALSLIYGACMQLAAKLFGDTECKSASRLLISASVFTLLTGCARLCCVFIGIR